MKIKAETLSSLADRFKHERKLQGLSREQAAAVCNVSPSFIRDAETHPGRCTLERLVQFAGGLGLDLTLTGWQEPPKK
ncbi:MAG: helix-turn-helix transcriptional regulator [Rubrivivax sp.]|nr:helix-turn-helix transcriptional regulator [Rubrivivax sp.]